LLCLKIILGGALTWNLFTTTMPVGAEFVLGSDLVAGFGLVFRARKVVRVLRGGILGRFLNGKPLVFSSSSL